MEQGLAYRDRSPEPASPVTDNYPLDKHLFGGNWNLPEFTSIRSRPPSASMPSLGLPSGFERSDCDLLNLFPALLLLRVEETEALVDQARADAHLFLNARIRH